MGGSSPALNHFLLRLVGLLVGPFNTGKRSGGALVYVTVGLGDGGRVEVVMWRVEEGGGDRLDGRCVFIFFFQAEDGIRYSLA